MLPTDDVQPFGMRVVSRLRGLELMTNGGDPERPLLSPSLCLILCEDEDGVVAPGRQPFPHLLREQLLVRAPMQALPFLQVSGRRARSRVLSVDLVDGRSAHRMPRFHSILLDAPPLVTLARTLCEAVVRHADADELRALLPSLMRPVLDGFAAGLSRPAPLTPAVARARDLLHERFADELPLDGMARTVTMSKCHLVHLFHKELGMPPHAYQIQLRVTQARRLVAAGTPLAEVASLTGFADQSHLTRLFKRIVGVSPGQYAAAVHVAPPEPGISLG
jgi:AraC-like DNA-binding protein